MANFKNVMEDLVLKEAQTQVSRLHPNIRARISLSEVVAFALNRLPPLYATTQQGWIYQHQRGVNEFELQITDVVRRSIHSLKVGDPLHDKTPLPEDELGGHARFLVKLQQVLNRDDLSWRDVPKVVKTVLDHKNRKSAPAPENNVSQPSSRLGISRRGGAADIKAYLQRSARVNHSANSLDEITIIQTPEERKELELYVTRAKLGYSNILEKFVTLIAQHLMRNLPPKVQKRTKLTDVVVYVLNRLPVMYATSDRGYRFLRQKAQAELSPEIMAKVRESIIKMANSPRPSLPPLPFEKFNQEHDQALSELREIVQQQDISWQNVIEIVATELAPLKSKNSCRSLAC